MAASSRHTRRTMSPAIKGTTVATTSTPMVNPTLASPDSDDDWEVTFIPPKFKDLNLSRISGSSTQRQNVRRRTVKRRHQESVSKEVDGSNSKSKSLKDDKENIELKEMVLSQMEVIQKQSDDIIKKERRLRDLQKENDKLRLKLSLTLDNNTRVLRTSTKSITDSSRPRLSLDKAVGTDDDEEDDSEVQLNLDPIVKDYDLNKDSQYLQSHEAYYLSMGEDHIEKDKQDIQKILAQSEIPAWRTNQLSPLYSMEGTEDIEDKVMLKRHNKPELDEKRRKKWDMQQMREQINVQRLKARYENGDGNKNKTQDSLPCSILPDLMKDLTHIEISDTLPVSAYSFPMALLDNRGASFSLPWKKS